MKTLINFTTLLLGFILGVFGTLYIQWRVWYDEGITRETFWEMLVRAVKSVFRE
jgi:hypothetical protein